MSVLRLSYTRLEYNKARYSDRALLARVEITLQTEAETGS